MQRIESDMDAMRRETFAMFPIEQLLEGRSPEEMFRAIRTLPPEDKATLRKLLEEDEEAGNGSQGTRDQGC